MGKLFDYLATPILSLILVLALYKFDLVCWENSCELIKAFPTIGTCSFGFLLTMFTVIIQGDNSAIQRMRVRKKPFIKFVSFNKYVVILSFCSTLYAYTIGNFSFPKSFTGIDYLVDIFYLLLIWFILQTIYFLIVFYILVKGSIN